MPQILLLELSLVDCHTHFSFVTRWPYLGVGSRLHRWDCIGQLCFQGFVHELFNHVMNGHFVFRRFLAWMYLRLGQIQLVIQSCFGFLSSTQEAIILRLVFCSVVFDMSNFEANDAWISMKIAVRFGVLLEDSWDLTEMRWVHRACHWVLWIVFVKVVALILQIMLTSLTNSFRALYRSQLNKLACSL